MATKWLSHARLAVVSRDSVASCSDRIPPSPSVATKPPRPGASIMMLIEGDLASESDGDASSYDGGSDEAEDDDDSGSDESDVDSDEEDVDLSELNERFEELGEVCSALESVDSTLWYRLHQIRGLDSLNRHFRAALQRTLQTIPACSR